MDHIKATINNIPELENLNRIGEHQWGIEFFSALRPKSHVFFTRVDGVAVGVEGYVAYPMIYKRQEVLAHRSERTLVSSSQRGKGIFQELVYCCDKEAKQYGSLFCWGATTALKPLVRAGFDQYTGFRSYVYYPVQQGFFQFFSRLGENIKLLNPLSAYRQYKKGNLSEIKKRLSFFQLFRSSGKGKRDISFQPINFDQSNSIVSNTLGERDIIAIKLSEALLGWLAAKNKQYKMYQVILNGEPVGHVIFSEHPEACSLNVVDIFVKERELIESILAKISAEYRNSRFISIFLQLNSQNDIHKDWLAVLKKKNAFIITRAGSFVIKSFTDKKFEIENLLLTDLWLEL